MLPRTDVLFVSNTGDPTGDKKTLRDPVALMEFGKAKREDKDSLMDTWFEKFGQMIKLSEARLCGSHGQESK